MSGGSFDYLYSKALGDALDHSGLVADMRDALLEYENGQNAAAATAALIAHFEKLQEMKRALEDVWHAVEWEHSCDTTREQTEKVLAKFNEQRPTSFDHPLKIAERVVETALPGGAKQWPRIVALVVAGIVAAEEKP